MTLSRKNFNKPAPKGFIKLKKAITVLSDAAVVILLALGYGSDSLTILIIRVGVSAVMESIQILISDEQNG